VEKTFVRKTHHTGHEVVLPVATVSGAKDGPTFAVISGMHAGEYAGILASQQLIQTVKPGDLRGRLIVVPVISVRSFMMRYMQLSAVDDREVHYYVPGNPQGSYTEFLVDTLWGVIKDANYVLDMHAGEFAQALYPWVPVPMTGSPEVNERSKSLALGYRVPYIELRSNRDSVPKLAAMMSDLGIANIWAEVGKNGLPTSEHVNIHYHGARAALQTVGMLPGTPDRPPQKLLTGRRYQINADTSGVWRCAVQEGDIVEKGQLLGRLTDYFGDPLREYHAPERSLVLYYWSSPAINADRRPHGYDWHNALISLITVE
jgi:predicted deacylase